MTKEDQRLPKLFAIESRDGDELSEYFSKHVSKVAISPTAKSKAVAIAATAVPLDQVIAFQADISVGAFFRQGEDADSFFLFLPTDSGQAVTRLGTKEFLCDSSTGLLARLNENDTVNCSDQWRHVSLKIPIDQLTRNLAELLDRPIANALEFAPEIDLKSAPVKSLMSMIQLALTPIDGEAAFATSPIAAAQFSESLSLLLLENFQHTYSDLLSPRIHMLRPKHVKRAIEYMRANAEQHLTLQEIAMAAGVSVRALHYGFKRFLGEPPFEHLRQIRLDAAYTDLTTAPETISIAEIAKKWGFPNSGRFAFHCKRCFGASPSAIREAALRSRRIR